MPSGVAASADPRTTVAARIDWFRVFTDLDRAGYSLRMVSATLNLPHETLRAQRDGCEPRYQTGEAITALWCRVKQRPLDDLPRINGREPSSAAKTR